MAMDIGHCLDQASFCKSGRRSGLFAHAFRSVTPYAVPLFHQRKKGLFLRIFVFLLSGKGRPPGFQQTAARGFPAGIPKSNHDFLRFMAHGRMKLQAEGGGYQQKQRAFIPGELFRAFAGGELWHDALLPSGYSRQHSFFCRPPCPRTVPDLESRPAPSGLWRLPQTVPPADTGSQFWGRWSASFHKGIGRYQGRALRTCRTGKMRPFAAKTESAARSGSAFLLPQGFQNSPLCPIDLLNDGCSLRYVHKTAGVIQPALCFRRHKDG